MLRFLPLLCTLTPGLALASPQLTDGLGLLQATEATAPVAASSGRNYDLEVNFRGRMMSIPKSLLDIWYFSDDPEVDAPPATAESPRPKIHGYALGLELVTKGESANGIFYFEYVDSLMEGGYWDDREGQGSIDHRDGEYLEPTDNLGLVTIGANYAYEAHFVRTEDTNGNFGMSLLVGGGLGVGIFVGEVYYWGYADGDSGLVRYQNGEESDGEKPGIPPVLPMVDLNAGLRFNFGDRFVLRFEGGLHTMLYYGAALGIMF